MLLADDAEHRRAIGHRLESLRIGKNWSLREAAQRAQLSHSFIRAVERGESEIAVSRLLRLADAYGVLAVDLLAERRPSTPELVAAVEPYTVPSSPPEVRLSYLASPSWSLQPFRADLAPGGRMADLHHEGDEFLIILEGVVIVEVGDQTTELSAGDTVVIPSYAAHGYRNESDQHAALLGATAADRIGRM